MEGYKWPINIINVFFFNDTATTEIYTLSLHDALPIFAQAAGTEASAHDCQRIREGNGRNGDRKSTRLNSSHLVISYAVFCLKKKKNHIDTQTTCDSVQSPELNTRIINIFEHPRNCARV